MGVISQATQGEDSDDEYNPTDHQRNVDYEDMVGVFP